MEEFEDAGATLVAISPQQAKYSRQLAQKHQLTFPLLVDSGNKVSEKFGIAWTMPGEMREIYKQFNLDVPRFNVDGSWTLPMPARYIVRQDGIIYDADVHPDYTKRPEPRETLEKLRRLTGE
ncbi:MAG: redoxin domain-containing protein [Desulfuromonadales bacterium]|nr:redoxin domain-containing protein [Desulfuromonadales bacterium]NIS39580.1 redoxin domain-containing protein [Desulfuromonadales bacterium]